MKVYGGIDQLTGEKLWLRQTVPARDTRRETEREAEKVLTRLLNQVDERRSPKTEATVNQLLGRWLDVIDVEKTTRTGYVGKIEKHIRPTIGRLQVGRITAQTIEGLYAQLRRCRDHCRGEKFVQHRTTAEHVCDEHSLDGSAPSSPRATSMPAVAGASGRVRLTAVRRSLRAASASCTPS